MTGAGNADARDGIETTPSTPNNMEARRVSEVNYGSTLQTATES